MIEEIRADVDSHTYSDILGSDAEDAVRITEDYILRHEIAYRKLNNLYANVWGVILMWVSVIVLVQVVFCSPSFRPMLVFAYLALSWASAYLMKR